MRIWLTSDTHFSHFNIIKYCNRPFHTVDEMNSAIIHNWNEQAKPEDIVIFCGDFCFARTAEAAQVTERFATALNGYKLIVKGNHDFKKIRYTDVGFRAEYYQEFIFNDRFSFRHRPDNLTIDSMLFDFIFYGHVHNTPLDYKAPLNCINACLDANDLKLIDITDYFTAKEIEMLKDIVNYDRGE